MTAATTYAPRRPSVNAPRPWRSPRCAGPSRRTARRGRHRRRCRATRTAIVSPRLSPRPSPSVPNTQLIGARLAPAQIQNWSVAVDVRCADETRSIPRCSTVVADAATSVLPLSASAVLIAPTDFAETFLHHDAPLQAAVTGITAIVAETFLHVHTQVISAPKSACSGVRHRHCVAAGPGGRRRPLGCGVASRGSCKSRRWAIDLMSSGELGARP